MSAGAPGLLTIALPQGIVATSARSGCVELNTMMFPDPPLCRITTTETPDGNTVLRVQVPPGDNLYVLQIMNLSAETGWHQIEYKFQVEQEPEQVGTTAVDTRD